MTEDPRPRAQAACTTKLDPDPILYTAHLLPSVGAFATVAALFLKVRGDRLKSQRRLGSARTIVRTALRIGEALKEDLQWFAGTCRPSMIDSDTGPAFVWDVGPYEQNGLDLLVRRLGASYKRLVDLQNQICLLYTSPSPRDRQRSRMPSSA